MLVIKKFAVNVLSSAALDKHKNNEVFADCPVIELYCEFFNRLAGYKLLYSLVNCARPYPGKPGNFPYGRSGVMLQDFDDLQVFAVYVHKACKGSLPQENDRGFYQESREPST